MTTALLVEFYRRLPERQEGDDPRTWLEQFQSAVTAFKKSVGHSYNEGTLQRLLTRRNREAALLLAGAASRTVLSRVPSVIRRAPVTILG